MNWTVLRVSENDVLNALMKDDLISRQSVSVRDHPEGGKVVLIEGADEALARAREMASDSVLEGEDAAEWYDRIKGEEESVASGVGMIFD